MRASVLCLLAAGLGLLAPASRAAETPPPAASPAAAASRETVDGETLFNRQCAGCHRKNGQGWPGFPPLAGNPALFLDRTFPVYVVLSGMTGPIEVAGQSYHHPMPPFDHLSDAAIAAVVGYVRGAWGNAEARPAGMAEVDADTVKRAREEAMTPAEVHARRAALQ